MPRKAEPITKEEGRIFHANFKFMWEKLSINYYHIKMRTETGKALGYAGTEILPAYSVLSRCANDRNYCPSRSVVNKIVAFYNMNITPDTDTWQFLHQRLGADPTRYSKKNDIRDERFLGVYYCYYPFPSEPELITGGMLKIYKTKDSLRAAMVSGLRGDAALIDDNLLTVFQNTPDLKQYDTYRAGLEKSDRRCSYYEGRVEITQRSLLIHFYEPSGAQKKMSMTFNVHQIALLNKPYDGGLGYMLSTSDGSYDTRFNKIGLINRSNGCVSLKDERVKAILKISESDGYMAMLTSSVDRAWYDMILASLIDGSRIVTMEQ